MKPATLISLLLPHSVSLTFAAPPNVVIFLADARILTLTLQK